LQGEAKARKRESPDKMLGITAFLRRSPIYMLLHGYATSRRDERPNEDWKETIIQFKKRYNIPDDIECDEAMYREIFRMTTDLINEGI
jgi:hypothetical protein